MLIDEKKMIDSLDLKSIDSYLMYNGKEVVILIGEMSMFFSAIHVSWLINEKNELIVFIYASNPLILRFYLHELEDIFLHSVVVV
jgi:hypothetical protein